MPLEAGTVVVPIRVEGAADAERALASLTAALKAVERAAIAAGRALGDVTITTDPVGGE